MNDLFAINLSVAGRRSPQEMSRQKSVTGPSSYQKMDSASGSTGKTGPKTNSRPQSPTSMHESDETTIDSGSAVHDESGVSTTVMTYY
jgi:hypothetical protein